MKLEFPVVKLPGEQKPVLLAVLAHPDDETFGMGGTLAMYARRGVDVYLVCATRGEVGDVPAEMLQGFNSVADLRESELRCATGMLQLAGIFFLGYRDSGMPGSADNHHPQALANTPEKVVAARVVHYIRQLKPQVVLTFDPIGGYRHPDHIAIHNATAIAFNESNNPDFHPEDLAPYRPQKLYFHVISKRMLRMAVRIMPLLGRNPHKFGRNGDIDLVSIVSVDFPTHASIDFTPVAEIRARAAACHSSQGDTTMAKGIQGWIMRLAGQRESFMRACPEPVKGRRERDLFEGVSV
jgi:N-acetyl-1-D-myo-inositol-2-amino-2-deoxy-alpha-D-glucopyranoside deacetylase